MCNSRTLDDVSHLLKDVEHFSVLMLQRVFFHLPIDALSRLLTAMLTPEGVFVFNILVMGLYNAGNLFESALCELLSGLPGVKILQMTFLSMALHKRNMVLILLIS